MPKILVRYAEIGLKGKNRKDFENQLIRNIRVTVKPEKITLGRKQLFIDVKSSLINQSLSKLQLVFGIAWLSLIIETKTNLEVISEIAIKLASNSKSFALRIARADKSIPFNSLDTAIRVGDKVRQATNSKVDLKNPQREIFIDLNKNFTHLYTEKINGPGGLPVGSSGKVLSLLSGGFDSIASSHLLAKRGAKVDFLHFHVFANENKVLNSKIKTIVDQLSAYTLSRRLFLASYTPFQMSVLDIKNSLQKQELVVFRRLMVKVGEQIAKKHGYQALVLGDSLGQVASQTMENIVAVDQAVDIPIFRPLIGMDKKDIIDLTRRLDLDKTATLPYKDCCSIVSQSPATRANLEKIQTIERKIKINNIVSDIISSINTISI